MVPQGIVEKNQGTTGEQLNSPAFLLSELRSFGRKRRCRKCVGAALQSRLSYESRLLRHGCSFLRRGNHLNNSMLSVPFRLNSSLRIDFECAPTVRVPHKFLHHLHVFAVSDQHRGKAVSERVPTDMLLYSGTRYRRTDDARKNDIGPIRALALGTRAREYPIVGLTVRAVLFPGPKFGGENWIHWHRFLRGFCLAIANHVPINRALN